MTKQLLLAFALLVLSSLAKAQPAGSLDNSFNASGTYVFDFGAQDNLTDIKVQPDQKIVSCGTALSSAFAGRLLVLRNNTDGTPDLSFNGTGYVMIESYTESYAYETQIRTDGKILVAGAAADSTYAFRSVVLRLNSNGGIDSTFGVNGFADIKVSGGDNFTYSMIELANHQLLLGGTALDTAFRNQPVVVRLNENGSIDSTFGVDGVAAVAITETDNRINDIELQTDGKIVAAGHYGNPITNDGQFDFDILVARFNANGTPDSTFAGDGVLTDSVSLAYIDDIFGLGINSKGKIAITGYTTLPDFSFDMILLQYDSTGARDVSFGNAGVVQFDSAAQDVASDLIIQADDKIIVAGTTGGFFFDNRDLTLLRYNANGTIDSSFGGKGYVTTEVMGYMDEINSVAQQADGKIVVAGKANNGNQNDVCLARYFSADHATGIHEAELLQATVFPNPVNANSVLTIETNQVVQQIALFDLAGRKITSLENEFNSHPVSFTVPAALSAGTYVLKLNKEVFRLLVR